jgi:type VI secretion system protein ImpL
VLGFDKDNRLGLSAEVGALMSALNHVDLNGIDSGNCSEKLVRLRRTRQADYFQRQGQLAAGMYLRRCTELQADGARSAYRAIATRYNATMLDNYPFATSISAPDAAPEQVRYMLRLLDAHYDNVRGWLALQQGDSAANALAFLDRLAAGRVLLGAMLQLAADGGVPAALDLWPEFRINRTRESGADQIIAWSVEAGAAAAMPDGPLAWRLGDPVALTLRWAKNSAREPAADSGRYPGLQVTAKQASWRYTGPWALLKAISSHAAAAADAGAETQLPQVLRFAVPTQYSDGKPAAETVAFARLGITLHGKPERLALPVFPHARAPSLAPAIKPAVVTADAL